MFENEDFLKAKDLVHLYEERNKIDKCDDIILNLYATDKVSAMALYFIFVSKL